MDFILDKKAEQAVEKFTERLVGSPVDLSQGFRVEPKAVANGVKDRAKDIWQGAKDKAGDVMDKLSPFDGDGPPSLPPEVPPIPFPPIGPLLPGPIKMRRLEEAFARLQSLL